MRRCAAILIWIVAGLPAASQAKKPSIVFDGISKDAGTVTQGETVKQLFTFTNEGTGILEVTGVRPT